MSQRIPSNCGHVCCDPGDRAGLAPGAAREQVRHAIATEGSFSHGVPPESCSFCYRTKLDDDAKAARLASAPVTRAIPEGSDLGGALSTVFDKPDLVARLLDSNPLHQLEADSDAHEAAVRQCIADKGGCTVDEECIQHALASDRLSMPPHGAGCTRYAWRGEVGQHCPSCGALVGWIPVEPTPSRFDGLLGILDAVKAQGDASLQAMLAARDDLARNFVLPVVDGCETRVLHPIPLYLSAGDASRVLEWARVYANTIDGAGRLRMTEADRELAKQIEEWLHPAVMLVPTPNVEAEMPDGEAKGD